MDVPVLRKLLNVLGSIGTHRLGIMVVFKKCLFASRALIFGNSANVFVMKVHAETLIDGRDKCCSRIPKSSTVRLAVCVTKRIVAPFVAPKRRWQPWNVTHVYRSQCVRYALHGSHQQKQQAKCQMLHFYFLNETEMYRVVCAHLF